MKIFRRLVAGEKSHATAARKNRILAQFVTGIALQFKQIVEGVVEGAESVRFCGFAKAKLPTAQIKDLRRGTRRGSLLPRPPVCQKVFFDTLSRCHAARFLYAINAHTFCYPAGNEGKQPNGRFRPLHKSYRCTRPVPSPPIRRTTSATPTRLKSPMMECFRQDAATANARAS